MIKKYFQFIIIIFLLFISLQMNVFAADKLIVLLDWFANPDHAPLFVAQQKDFFKQQNLDVELIGPADPADPPKLVAAGKADIAIDYQPQLIEQVNRGLPLVRIGTLIDQPLTCLTVLENSPIKTIADLKHKRVGFSSGDINSAILKVMLEKNGLTLNDIEPVSVHYNLTQALLSRKVDAVTGMMRNFELTQLELAGYPGRAFYPEKNGVPPYSELIFVAQKDKQNDPRFLRFLTALEQSTAYLKKHPEETWKAFAKMHPELNNELNRRAWFATIPYFANHPADLNEKNWLQFAEFMLKNKLINKVQPIDQYAVSLAKRNAS